jgi:hypothetical protein
MITIKIRPPNVVPVVSILLTELVYLYGKFILINISEQTRINNVIMIPVLFIY